MLNSANPADHLKKQYPSLFVWSGLGTFFRKSTASPKHPQYRHPLPKHGVVYFEHVRAEYEHLDEKLLSEKSRTTVEQILRKAEEAALTWSDVYTYESIFLRLLQDESMPRKVWDLRNRYRDVVGLKEYEAYLASKPPEISGELKYESLRADSEFLLNKIYLKYSLAPFSEEMRGAISKKVTGWVLIGLFCIIVAGISPSLQEYISRVFPALGASMVAGKHLPSATILMVLFAGAMGGLMSMLQRYNSLLQDGDPINSISIYPWYQTFIPAINGAFFAVLLYVIFLGGMVKGDFFPDIAPDSSSKEFRSGLTAFLTDYGGTIAGTNYAKLIIWSFIAGFAERLVPDTLSKIMSKKDNAKESGTV